MSTDKKIRNFEKKSAAYPAVVGKLGNILRFCSSFSNAQFKYCTLPKVALKYSERFVFENLDVRKQTFW